MDLGTMLRVMLRRWYVTIPALIVAVALPAAAWTAIAAKYQTTSTISLLNSTAASSANQRTGNPFLAFDSSLTPVADLLARRLSSDQSAADLAARGVVDPAAAVLAPNASGPFLTMTVTGKDQAKVMTELQTFDDYAISQLAAIQTSTTSSLPVSSLIRAVVVVPPQKPTTSSKTKYEDVAGAGVVGMAVLFLSVFGTEAVVLRRERARMGLPRRRSDSVPQAAPLGISSGISSGIASSSPNAGTLPGTITGGTPTGTGAGIGGSSANIGTLARRAPSTPHVPNLPPQPSPSAAQLPHYREPEFDPEDENETEPWIDVHAAPFEHLAITDRDPGSL
jgi:hypothetical protein